MRLFGPLLSLKGRYWTWPIMASKHEVKINVWLSKLQDQVMCFISNIIVIFVCALWYYPRFRWQMVVVIVMAAIWMTVLKQLCCWRFNQRMSYSWRWQKHVWMSSLSLELYVKKVEFIVLCTLFSGVLVIPHLKVLYLFTSVGFQRGCYSGRCRSGCFGGCSTFSDMEWGLQLVL